MLTLLKIQDHMSNALRGETTVSPQAVKDFAEAAFSRAGLNWQDHVETDKKYIRPTEVDALIGDPSKVEKALGWKAKTHWKELAELMVDADIAALK